MEARRRNPLRRYPTAVCISVLHFGLTQPKTRALNSPGRPPIPPGVHRNRIRSLVRVEHRLYRRRRPHRACRIQHAARPTYAHPSCIDWIC